MMIRQCTMPTHHVVADEVEAHLEARGVVKIISSSSNPVIQGMVSP